MLSKVVAHSSHQCSSTCPKRLEVSLSTESIMGCHGWDTLVAGQGQLPWATQARYSVTAALTGPFSVTSPH